MRGWVMVTCLAVHHVAVPGRGLGRFREPQLVASLQ